MNLQRAYAGCQIDDAGNFLRRQRIAQRLHAQPQFEIQHHLAEFDEYVFIARAADGDIAMPASRIAGSSSARTNFTRSPGLQLAHLPQIIFA